jgi:hypothetical protein
MIRSLTQRISGQGRRGRHGRPASGRDRRNRRNAHLTLESLDNRIVLSAAAAGAAAQAAVHTRAALREHRHEAWLARLEARHEASFGKAGGVVLPIVINTSPSAAAPVLASPAAVGSAPETSVSSGHATSSSTTTAVSATNANPAPVTITPGSTGASSSGPLPGNVAAALQELYKEYESQGGGSSFTPDEPDDNLLVISGTSVGVEIKASPSADFNSLIGQLRSDGMQISNSSATYGLVDGMLPIADLGVVAQLAGTASVTPIIPPIDPPIIPPIGPPIDPPIIPPTPPAGPRSSPPRVF